MRYCNKCGKEMKEVIEGEFSCSNCKSNNIEEEKIKNNIIDKSIEYISTTNIFPNIIPILVVLNIIVFVLASGSESILTIMIISIFISILIYIAQNSENIKKTEKMKKRKKEIINELNRIDFEPTLIMLTLDCIGIIIDEKNKKIAVSQKMNEKPKIYKFEDILSYELIEDGMQQIEGKAWQSFAAGNFLGTDAAIAAANATKDINQLCTNLYILINTKELQNENSKIILVEKRLNKVDDWYKNLYNLGKESIITLDKIINSIKNEAKTNEIKELKEESLEKFSIAEEIKKFKELLDLGAITEKEYETKKKELLNKKYSK